MIDDKYTLDWLLETYMPFYSRYGMNRENLKGYFITWSKNRPPLVLDYAWYLFMRILQITASDVKDIEVFHRENYAILSEMVMFRRRYEDKPANDIWHDMIIERIQVDLIKVNNLNVASQVKHIAKCCPYCDNFNGQTYAPIDIIEKRKGYDPSKCTREVGCICLYTVAVKRDDYGRPVLL